nr:carboxypeptidase-like regulatory domain-containing protein [uncultured Lacibacter sp.]
MRSLLLLGFMLISSLFSIEASAQTVKISGLVLSKDDNTAVPDVSVTVKGKGTGTKTGADGRFSINASIGDVLVFSSVSFIAQEVKVENADDLTIALSPSASKMDEVVVVGT